MSAIEQANSLELPVIPSEIKETFFEISPSVIKHKDKAIENLKSVSQIKRPDVEFYWVLISLAEVYLSSSMDSVQIPYSILQDQLKTLGKPYTRQTILKRSKTFVELGIFSKALKGRGPEGGRPYKRFTTEPIHLSDFTSQIDQSNSRVHRGRKITRGRSTTNSKKIIEQLEKSDAQYFKAMATSKPLTDNFWTGILDRSLRFDNWEQIEGNRITTSVRIGKARLTVQATTQTGKSSEIAILADQRIIRAIITMVVETIEKAAEKQLQKKFADFEAENDLFSTRVLDNETGANVDLIEYPGLNDDEQPNVKNEFFIDTVDIASMLGFSGPSSGDTKARINAAIRRLYETNFRVILTGDTPEDATMLRKKFGLDDDAMDFRFITDIKSQFQEGFAPDGVNVETGKLPSIAQQRLAMGDLTQEELEELADPFHKEELKRIRLWKISIDSHLFNRLMDKEARSIFVAHDEIMKERSGLAQTLYNLLSHKIGRTNPALRQEQEKTVNTSFEKLHNFLWPGRDFERFEEHFFALLRRHSENPEIFSERIKQANVSKRTNEFRPHKVLMFGFMFLLSIKDRQWWITIYRDRKDEINGDNSYHNRMLAKSNSRSKLS